MFEDQTKHWGNDFGQKAMWPRARPVIDLAYNLWAVPMLRSVGKT
jgi:hypothetical protein